MDSHGTPPNNDRFDVSARTHYLGGTTLFHIFPALPNLPIENIVIRFRRELNALVSDVPSFNPLNSRLRDRRLRSPANFGTEFLENGPVI